MTMYHLFIIISLNLITLVTSLSSSTPIAEVSVCTNRFCKEKGSDATIATFNFLCPQQIHLQSVNCLGRCNKGPNVRIVKNGIESIHESIRSVETVANLLQNQIGVLVNLTSAEVLRLNYDGNLNLSQGDIDGAIKCYDQALRLGDLDQEGVLRVMRGTALLQRAYALRLRHRSLYAIASDLLPLLKDIKTFLFDALSSLPFQTRYTFASTILLRIGKVYDTLDSSSKWNEYKSKWPVIEGPPPVSGKELLRKVEFTYSLYEYSLMQSLEDLFLSTIVLPEFAQGWRRVGDALMELNKFQSAIDYYQIAMKLDESLIPILLPAIERLKVMERLVENAEAKGFSVEEMLSLIEEK